MFSNLHRGPSGRPNVRRGAAAALSATLIGTLAALPPASALASSGSGGSGAGGSGTNSGSPAGSTAMRTAATVHALASTGELLPAGELEELLARLPLSDISAAQLAHYLAGLEGIAGLTGLEGLLGKELGAVGLEEALTKAIEQLKLSDPSATLGELPNLEGLLPALEGKLGGLLKTLLGPLLSEEQQQALEGALGTLKLEQLVASLLGSVAPQEPLASELSGLAGGLFGELGGEGKLEGVLGGELTGGFAPQEVKRVAEELNTTPQAISEELGQTTAQLPETATMLTAPLTAGKLVGIAPALKGLALGLLGGTEGGGGAGEGGEGSGGGGSGSGEGSGAGGKGTGEGSGSGAGGSGSGGSGAGAGGTGAGGSQGGTGEGGRGGQGGSTGGMTILLTLPAGSPSAQGAAAAAKHGLGKVRILRHSVRGHVATIVLQLPAAGRVALSGRGVRTARGHAAKAQRLTLRVPLSKAALAALHRGGHHRVRVELEASFKPTAGAGSTASVVVTFA